MHHVLLAILTSTKMERIQWAPPQCPVLLKIVQKLKGFLILEILEINFNCLKTAYIYWFLSSAYKKWPLFGFQMMLQSQRTHKKNYNFWTKFGNSDHSGKAGPLTVCISQLVERSLFEDKGWPYTQQQPDFHNVSFHDFFMECSL